MDKPRRISKKKIFTSYGSKFSIIQTKDLVGNKIIISNFVKESNCVIILPILKNGSILLERQYRAALFSKDNRKALNGYTYELPGGHMTDEENIEKAVYRELEEETGYTAKRVKILYKRAMASYLTTAKEWVCIAEELSKTKKSLDEDEIINIVEMNKKNIVKNLKNGKIEDTLTREALLYYLYFYE